MSQVSHILASAKWRKVHLQEVEKGVERVEWELWAEVWIGGREEEGLCAAGVISPVSVKHQSIEVSSPVLKSSRCDLQASL